VGNDIDYPAVVAQLQTDNELLREKIMRLKLNKIQDLVSWQQVLDFLTDPYLLTGIAAGLLLGVLIVLRFHL
jgi:hypothetical protein